MAGGFDAAISDPDEQRALLRLLHDLGVVVAHGFERRATVIEQSVTLLDPNWLTGAIYNPAKHVDVFDLEDSNLCFVTFNSAWNTARRSPEQSTIVDGAVNEVSRRLHAIGDSRLKIAVWHHPITGNEKIKNDAFLERLRGAGIRLCLHGHIHESRTELLGYLHPRKMLAIGTGSFGAPWQERAESTPRLYHLLEIRQDWGSVRVYTRGLKKLSGAWGPSYEWPDPVDPGNRQSYFDFEL